MAKILGGFQPDTKSESARRADFDLQRKVGKGGGGAALPPGADPGEVLTIDGSGNPVWAAGTPGPAGPQGPPGATGPQGPAGATGQVPAARTIATTAPLTGGGDLSVNRTLAINTFSTTVSGAVPAPGTVAGKVLSDNGTWIASGGGPGAGQTYVIAPAQAGPGAAPADARFGLVGASAGEGFFARTGLLYIQMDAGNQFAVYGAPTGQIVLMKAADPTYPSARFVGEVSVSGAGAGYTYKGGRDGSPTTDVLTYVAYGTWNLWSVASGGANIMTVNVTNGWVKATGPIESDSASNGIWNSANIMAISGTSVSNIAIGVSGYVPQWRSRAIGEVIEAVNSSNNAYVPIWASAFTVSSAAVTKTGVRALRPEREHITVRREPLVDEVAAPDIMGLRPVAYRPKVIGRRIVATDGDSYVASDPDSWTWEDEPEGCPIDVQNRRERLGLVADEVQHVIPSAVAHDAEGEPTGIDYAQITVALLDHVQELTRTVETLRYRITELEGRP